MTVLRRRAAAGERDEMACTLPFAGEQTYLLHCHILEHEDGGMMVNYTVA